MISRRRSGVAAVLARLLVLTGSGPAAAGGLAAIPPPRAVQLYERTLMAAADGRCRLFDPSVGAALRAARAQARGAALRSGMAQAQVDAVEARAEARADAAPCTSRDLAAAAVRVRNAFSGYAGLRTLTFPGDFAVWSADRRPPPPPGGSPGPRFRLWQDGQVRSEPLGTAAGRVRFGVTTTGELSAVWWPAPEGEVGEARILYRDPSKLAKPYLDPRSRELAGRAPPRNVTAVFLARSLGPAPPGLAPGTAGISVSGAPEGGAQAVFPRETIKALMALDPREAFKIEFVRFGAGQEHVAGAYLEVGDLAAAEAFLAAGR